MRVAVELVGFERPSQRIEVKAGWHTKRKRGIKFIMSPKFNKFKASKGCEPNMSILGSTCKY